MTETEIALRLTLAARRNTPWFRPGTSRNFRRHPHAPLVSLSSAVITVPVLLLYETLTADDGNQDIDSPCASSKACLRPSGSSRQEAIFVAKGDVHNLTSAANLWRAAAIGTAAGAGQYFLLGAGLVLGLIVVTGVRLLAWLRSPGVRWARIPLGLRLIVGGVASLLPVLGTWMLPLGLLLLALDVPLLQKPTHG